MWRLRHHDHSHSIISSHSPIFKIPLIFILSLIPLIKRQSSSATLLHPRSLFFPSHPPFLCSLFFAFSLSLSSLLFSFFFPSFHSFDSSVACHRKVKKKEWRRNCDIKRVSFFFNNLFFSVAGERGREGGRSRVLSLILVLFPTDRRKKDGALIFIPSCFYLKFRYFSFCFLPHFTLFLSARFLSSTLLSHCKNEKCSRFLVF